MNDSTLCAVKHVTLICEEALEELVGKDIIEAGAKGYTVTDARGRGNRGVRDAQWLLSSNIRVDVLCSEPVARHILTLIESKYAQHYGLIIFMQDASVLASQKY